MPISESVLIALFCMAVVFAILGMLWGIIRIFSSIIQALEHASKNTSKTKL